MTFVQGNQLPPELCGLVSQQLAQPALPVGCLGEKDYAPLEGTLQVNPQTPGHTMLPFNQLQIQVSL